MWKECWIIEEFEAPRKVKTQKKEPINKSKGKENANGEKKPTESSCLYGSKNSETQTVYKPS